MAEVDSSDGSKDVDSGLASGEDPYYLAEVGFWDRVVELEELWQSHLARWPDTPKSSADRARPDDPPGSWRGDGDRYLTPDQNAESDQLITALREPEKVVTAVLRRIADDSPHGGFLEGLDHRLKGEQRLKEKIADKIAVKSGLDAADAAQSINDAVRYTFCFGTDEYVSGCEDICQRLESAGYRRAYRENHWLDDPQYKGINSRWESPEGGRFELQFHTMQSFYAKEHLTHPSYERLRSPGTSWTELRALKDFQRIVSAAVPVPPGIEKISNSRGRA